MRLKNIFFIVMLFLLMIFNTNAKADYATGLVFNGYVQDSFGDIDVGSWSAPTVYDWNADGKKDLIVGQRVSINGITSGRVSYFENIGTNDSPVFGSSSYLQACSNTCTLQVAGGG
ncbi:MAG: hypothetical protein C4581_10650 [Nitrospiraceae bacterium]|nr:MAG: hypothetical protein C4581_10650 [Nitrospiraceae bacterium]